MDMKKTTKLRLYGGVFILVNLFIIGRYSLPAFPAVWITFGFAIWYEIWVVRLVSNSNNDDEEGAKIYPQHKEENKNIFMEKKEKTIYIRLAIVVVVMVGLYYLFSPYQNCKRDLPKSKAAIAHCTKNTSW